MSDKLFPVHAGFLPLLDSGLMVIAKEKGFAKLEGIDLTLIRENSWANIRDRMAVGQFDIAHMLAPMPIAARLGLTPISLNVIAPMALGLGGNAITVASSIAKSMNEIEHKDASSHAGAAGFKLKQVVEQRKASNEDPLIFAVVHPHSVHNYELRYWLASCGIVPDEDIKIIILPPPSMPDALHANKIDGFCVGEPWNTAAAANSNGVIITTKSEIWRSSPEKVLGVSESFAEKHEFELQGLIRSMIRAGQWCADRNNHIEFASILSKPDYVDIEDNYLLPAISGTIPFADQPSEFFTPFDKAATFPWKSHAAWFYSQMLRWGQIEWNPDHVDKVMDTYRPDIYRSAVAPLDIAVPSASSKVEGALTKATSVGAGKKMLTLGPDGFFDGRIFDPNNFEDYVKSQNPSLDQI